jgi:hypothetical protein
LFEFPSPEDVDRALRFLNTYHQCASQAEQIKLNIDGMIPAEIDLERNRQWYEQKLRAAAPLEKQAAEAADALAPLMERLVDAAVHPDINLDSASRERLRAVQDIAVYRHLTFNAHVISQARGPFDDLRRLLRFRASRHETSAATNKPDPIAIAVAMKVAQPRLSVRAIAGVVGISYSKLQRAPLWQSACQRLKQTGKGNVERMRADDAA